jgi:signal transduction histidine kinase
MRGRQDGAQTMDFNQTAEVLIAFPGNLVYHLVVSMSVVLLFSLVRLYPQPEDGSRSRWAFIALAILLLQTIYLAIGAGSQLISGNLLAMLPSLDRFLSLCTLGFFSWGFLVPKPFKRVNQIAAGLIVAGLLAVLSELLIAPDPRRADQVWTILGLLGLLFILIRVVTKRPSQWFLVQSAVVILLAGYFLHLTGSAEPPALQGMVRWAELAAYPLFVLAAARSLTLEVGSQSVPAAASRKLGPQPELIAEHQPEQLLPEIGELLSANRDEALAKNAVRTVAHIMRSEFCLLLTPPDLSGQFAIGAAYDLIQEHHLGGAPLEASETPIIAAALSRRKAVSLPANSRAPDLRTLQQALSIDAAGPLLLVPMVERGHLEGGILLLSPFARKRWSEDERKTVEDFAHYLAARFRQLRHQSDPEPVESAESSAQVSDLEEEIDRLSEMLREASQEGGTTADEDKLAAILEMHEEAQATIQTLEAENERLSTALARLTEQDNAAELVQMAEDLQNALQELATTRAQLTHARMKIDRQKGYDSKLAGSLITQLRQPLYSLVDDIGQLRQQTAGKLERGQIQLMTRIHAGLDRSGALLEQLVQVLNLDAAPDPNQPSQPVDLLGCLETAVTRSGDRIREKNLMLRMDFPETLPYVMGDKTTITKIFVHLILNAIMVSPDQAEIVISTDMRTENNAEFLTCSISDQGPGLSPQEIQSAFDSPAAPAQDGVVPAGQAQVNLAEVRKLSESIGGRVWVESQAGSGSTYTVLLPLADPPSNSSDMEGSG